MLRRNAIHFMIAAMLIGLSASSAQQPEASSDSIGKVDFSASVNQSSVLVAEPFRFRLQVDAPPNARLTWPEVGEQLGELVVLSQQSLEGLPIEGNDDLRRSVLLIELEAIESGSVEVPSVEVIVDLPRSPTSAEMTHRLRSDPIAITVNSVLKEGETPEEFRDIKGMASLSDPVATTDRRGWLYATGVVALVVLAAALIWFRRGQRPAADRWAMEQIHQIEQNAAYSDTGAIADTEMIDQLSRILREYLELHLGIPAISKSSEEIAEQLRSADRIDSEARGIATSFLIDADRLRFAGRSELEQQESPCERIREFIQRTRDLDERST